MKPEHLVVALSVLYTAAYAHAAGYQEYYASPENLHGRIKFLSTTETTAPGKALSYTRKYEVAYSEAGIRQHEEHYAQDVKGQLKLAKEIRYDFLGRYHKITGWVEQSGRSAPMPLAFAYDGSGRLLLLQEDATTRKRFVYDGGRLIQTTTDMFWNGTWCERDTRYLEYGSQGRPVKEYSLYNGKEVRVKKIYHDGQSREFTEPLYVQVNERIGFREMDYMPGVEELVVNKDGVMWFAIRRMDPPLSYGSRMEYKSYDQMVERIETRKYTFDEEGNTLVEEIYFAGKLFTEYRYEYTRDEAGNWIRKEIYNVTDGQRMLSKRVTRRIEYY